MTCIGNVRLALAYCAVAAFCATAQEPPATLTVKGDVAAPLALTAEEFGKLPRQKATVTGEDGASVTYEGVLLRDLLQRAGAPSGKDLRGKALAAYVLAKAHDGYEVVFTLGELAPEFGNEPILVADKRDGKVLFGYQGPFRLVCPNDKAGARSVRMLESLEVVKLRK